MLEEGGCMLSTRGQEAGGKAGKVSPCLLAFFFQVEEGVLLAPSSSFLPCLPGAAA